MLVALMCRNDSKWNSERGRLDLYAVSSLTTPVVTGRVLVDRIVEGLELSSCLD